MGNVFWPGKEAIWKGLGSDMAVVGCSQMSYHKFNEQARRRELIQRLHRGEVLALISDAGMPGISDPGSELVRFAL